MKNPFPGMNPYLEHPSLWPDVHNSLITAIRDYLAPAVAPNYYVGVESRAYVMTPEGMEFIGRPDVAVISPMGVLPSKGGGSLATAEAGVLEVELPFVDELTHYYLEIRGVETHTLITVIEILSPVNKMDKRGRQEYLDKRLEMQASRTSFVEIDLLRAGEPLPMLTAPPSDYRILVSRAWQRSRAHLYHFNLPAPIPAFPVPLLRGETEPLVPLNEILHALYGRARFDLRINYQNPPLPPLSEPLAAWAAELVASE